MTDDGSVVMSCKSNGDFGVSGSSAASSVADGYNFVAVKLDSEGNVLWTWQVRP